MWVPSLHRPLNSLEQRHALATRLNDDDLDVDNIPPSRLIVRSCCGLIAVDDLDDDRVQRYVWSIRCISTCTAKSGPAYRMCTR